MKLGFIYLSMILLSIFAPTKISLQNLTIKNPKSKKLYCNVQNKIKVTGVPKDLDYKLTSKYCVVNPAHAKEGIFILFPKGYTKKTDTLKIMSNDKELARFTYSIDSVQFPLAFINKVPNNGKVKIEQLKADRKFQIKQAVNSPCDCNYEFQSYTMIVISEKATKTMVNMNEAKMAESWKVIDYLSDGTKIIVKDIYLKSEKCGSLRIENYSFTVFE